MNNLSNADFVLDKSTKTATIHREFEAPLSLVWDAFTRQEILDQWWAPKPWASRTKDMNFEDGGRRFYAMVGPEGQESWSLQQFTAITPKSSFKMFNAFADKEGNPNLPGSDWTFNFHEAGSKTVLDITIYNESLERMEKMMEMGFKEGFTMTLESLDGLLATQKAKS